MPDMLQCLQHVNQVQKSIYKFSADLYAERVSQCWIDNLTLGAVTYIQARHVHVLIAT